jgi:hypothetical protein
MEASAMQTYRRNITDEFLRLTAEVLTFSHDACLIDRLTTAGGYSQLLELDPQNTEYQRKFEHALDELLAVLVQHREYLLGNASEPDAPRPS